MLINHYPSSLKHLNTTEIHSNLLPSAYSSLWINNTFHGQHVLKKKSHCKGKSSGSISSHSPLKDLISYICHGQHVFLLLSPPKKKKSTC